MNLPNKITIFRIILVPLFVVLLLVTAIPYHELLALIVFSIACISDALDGYLARKRNLVTDFGKFMDPLADKILVCSALICFVENGQMPAWIVLIIIAREFIINGFRLIAANKGVVIAASVWAKTKTAAQMITCFLLILNIEGTVVYILEQIMIYLSLALTVISLVDYIVKNRTIMSDGKHTK